MASSASACPRDPIPRRGHKTTGLSISLDGSEDYLVGREAAEIWKSLGMAEERRKALQEVDDLIASGAVASFADWQKVVRHPEDPGAQNLEGAEFEGELASGEKSWITLEDEALIALDESDFFKKKEEAVPRADPAEAEASRLAVSAAARLAQLKVLRADHMKCRLPAAAGLVDQEIKQVSRGLHASGRAESQRATAKLREHMDSVVAQETKLLVKRQQRQRKLRRIALKQKVLEKRRQRNKKAAAKAKAKLAKKLAELPVTFSAADCSRAGDPGLRSRIDCLERLKVRSPPLPFDLEMDWNHIRTSYAGAKKLREVYKLKHFATVGYSFIDEINGVLEKLVEHYSGPSRYNKEGEKGGDAQAFERFVSRMKAKVLPAKAATRAEM